MLNEKMKKNVNPEEDTRYHDTLLLLQKYRRILWSMEAEKRFLECKFETEYGRSIDEYLAKAETLGIDIDVSDLENRTRSIARSVQMTKLIEKAVNLVRESGSTGEATYQILTLCYMNPEKIKENLILAELAKMGFPMGEKTMRRLRKQGIEYVSTILWGYTSKDTLDAVNQLIQTKIS